MRRKTRNRSGFRSWKNSHHQNAAGSLNRHRRFIGNLTDPAATDATALANAATLTNRLPWSDPALPPAESGRLQHFFAGMAPESGLAFVVAMSSPPRQHQGKLAVPSAREVVRYARQWVGQER